MKIVDEKGKIFGKLNIIDLLVLVVLVVAVVLVGLKLTGNNEDVSGGATKLVYTVEVKSVEPEVFENIQQYLPDALMANGKLADAQITKAVATPHIATAAISTMDGSLILPVNENTLDVVFTVEANVENAMLNTVGTQEVRIGKSHIVKTVHFELNYGVILSCDWETPPQV